MKIPSKYLAFTLLCLFLLPASLSAQSNTTPPTPEEAKKFIDQAEQDLFDLGVKASRAGWVQENFITVDTEAIAADANERANTAATNYAKQAHRFDHVQLSPE
jgi:peptidyl-dipeptidase A